MSEIKCCHCSKLLNKDDGFITKDFHWFEGFMVFCSSKCMDDDGPTIRNRTKQYKLTESKYEQDLLNKMKDETTTI